MSKTESIKKQCFHILTTYKKFFQSKDVNVAASKVSKVDVIGLHHLGRSSQADPKANRVANTQMSNNSDFIVAQVLHNMSSSERCFIRSGVFSPGDASLWVALLGHDAQTVSL